MPLYYSIGLLFLFVLLLIVEFFIPSAGMLGVAAAITAVVAIVVGFTHSVTLGAAISLIIATITPVILASMIKIWPNTIIGRMILNRRIGEEDEPIGYKTQDGEPLETLIGEIGEARTDMLPAGRISVGGRKMDAVSIGAPIDAGTKVAIVQTSAGKIRVRAALPEEIAAIEHPVSNTTEFKELEPTSSNPSPNPGPGTSKQLGEDDPKPTKGQSDISKGMNVLETLDLDSMD